MFSSGEGLRQQPGQLVSCTFQIQNLEACLIDPDQFRYRWRLLPPAPGNQSVGRTAAAGERKDPATLAKPVQDVPLGDLSAPCN